VLAIAADQTAKLTYSGPWSDWPVSGRQGPHRAVNAGFTGLRQINRRDEGKSQEAMSTLQTNCAIERTAGNAGAAASLILGTLLLLIRPW